MADEIHSGQPQGKRILPGSGHKKALLILAAVVGALALVYTGLCLYVAFGGRILPGVHVGTYNVGTLPDFAAQEQLTATSQRQFSAVNLTVTFGEDGTLTVPGSYAAVDAPAAARAAFRVGREGSPLTYGFHLVKALFGPTQVTLHLMENPDFPQGSTLLDDAFRGHENPVVETVYTVEETAIRMTRGTPGLTYDRDACRSALLAAIADVAQGLTQETSLRLEPVETLPAPVDWQALAAKIHVEAADAALNPETMEIEPSVTGVSLDVTQAAARYDNTRDGADFEVPLVFTQPEMTTEQLHATLFQDLLGEATSKVSGVANRKQNVKLAAELVNDTILLPEGIFAYNECTGPRTTENGFRPAPSYVDGLTVDEVGGGICQVSSTVYYAVLNSNLKIVERRNHSFAVGYVPDGMDATVFFGSLDFRFQNDTPSPIKIVTQSYDKDGSRWLTVKIYGNKVDDTYVKMEAKRLSTTDFQTVYKPDPAIPIGTTKVSVTPYTGRKVESYRCVYAADGTLLSRTLEAVSNYKKRDKVILYNPADAHLYDPNATPPATVAPSATPGGTPAPTQSQPPTASVPPAVESTAPPTLTVTPPGNEALAPEFQVPAPTATPQPTPEPVPIDTLPTP